MKLECIVTLANQNVRLRFLAMERSLRATGCDLPLRVIPYDDNCFTLPENSNWWLDTDFSEWLMAWKSHPMMRKYQCMLIPNFQFVDADVCFLRNPADVLQPHAGFITSCGHWHNPDETLTEGLKRFLSTRSTTWQKGVFNAGQWACDRALFTPSDIRRQCEEVGFRETCLTFRFHDQPGVNLLVNASGIPIHNLTLPPWNMQSTWAGDYPDDFRSYWRTVEETPYLIHWAGTPMEVPRPINELFFNFLTPSERKEWDAQVATEVRRREVDARSLRARARRWRNGYRAFVQAINPS